MRPIDGGRAAVAMSALLWILWCGDALATEGGGSSKALGVDTVMAGVMPPPGLRLTTFLSGYEADKTLDADGNPRRGISDFHVRAEAATLRLQYVWPGVELWGANVETRFGGTAYVHSKLSFDVQTPGGRVHREDTAEAPGDILVAPVLLGWHGESVHQIAGIEFFLGTGAFDPTALVNPSRGYDAVGPAYFLTWFPNDRTEVSISSVYLYNWTNSHTNYQSGQEINVDYGVGYHVTPALQLGASGYLYKQVTDDRLNGQAVAGGNRGQALAIGPFVRWHPSDRWGVTFKWQAETSVRNRAEGNRFFLQIALQL